MVAAVAGIGDVVGVRVRRPEPEAPAPDLFQPEPAILTHPNIPKPLHGMNPRTLLGQAWWDQARHAAYASTRYRCLACGVPKEEAQGPKWLEAHEWWNIDYARGRCEVKRIVPLCHYCHNFIHSGRLLMIAGTDKPMKECVAILEHGFQILRDHKLRAFYGTVEAAHELGARTFGVRAAPLPKVGKVGWGDWVLVLEGSEYYGQFSDAEAWRRHYQGADDEDDEREFELDHYDFCD